MHEETTSAKPLAKSLSELIAHLRMARRECLLIVATDNPVHEKAVAEELKRR